MKKPTTERGLRGEQAKKHDERNRRKVDKKREPSGGL
jgi:hypothetical protein